MCLAELELQQVSDKTHQPLCPNEVLLVDQITTAAYKLGDMPGKAEL